MRKKKIIPPADIILDVIYDAPCAEEKVLKFYDNYINSAAKEAVSGKEEFVINEDLVQDIRLAVLNALPYFRKYCRVSPSARTAPRVSLCPHPR